MGADPFPCLYANEVKRSNFEVEYEANLRFTQKNIPGCVCGPLLTSFTCAMSRRLCHDTVSRLVLRYRYLLNNAVVYRESHLIGPFECAGYAWKPVIGQHPCTAVARFEMPGLVLLPAYESFDFRRSLSVDLLLCQGISG